MVTSCFERRIPNMHVALFSVYINHPQTMFTLHYMLRTSSWQNRTRPAATWTTVDFRVTSSHYIIIRQTVL